MKKNTSKLQAMKQIARTLLQLNDFLEKNHLTNDLKQLRFMNRSLLRYKSGLQTPIK